MTAAAIIASLFCGWRIARRTRFFLHIFQLQGYKPKLFRQWLEAHSKDALFRTSHILGALWLIILMIAGRILPGPVLVLIVLLWAATFASSRRYRRDKPKKPLVFTYRLRRLLGLCAALLLIPVISGVLLAYPLTDWDDVFLFLSGLYVADLGAPFSVLLGSLIARPFERRIQNGFRKKARLRLAGRSDLDVIAITGSYGKTCVKNVIDEVLSHRFAVLATPGSYNTPMGICKVINNDLTEGHRKLILEMGIRHPGDIAKLCRIVRPNIALITSVGLSHLETMGSVDAIEKEKASILSFLMPGGHAVLNADDERVRAMANGFDAMAWFVSTDESSGADITAGDISYGPEGAAFSVTDATGDTCSFNHSLVGLHNVTN
ncbi:MAG: UDP-N-acetylmuramoyl-tripeptide--D-alanyl-D-alanine ligase, partial [Bacteroidetes bacterium]|nr:UDP-N-acetylmuramoyl-tripeptide--D-alanyl-D-alanine ligase [Bacteroidota bacterium]